MELNNFTVKKLESNKQRGEFVQRIREGLDKGLAISRKLYPVYMEAMEIYDKVAMMLKSTSKTSQALSTGNQGRRSLIKTFNPNDAKGLLVLKNVLQPVYNKFKQFRLNIQADQFRPLVAAFLYNFDRAVEALEPPVVAPESPTDKVKSSHLVIAGGKNILHSPSGPRAVCTHKHTQTHECGRARSPVKTSQKDKSKEAIRKPKAV